MMNFIVGLLIGLNLLLVLLLAIVLIAFKSASDKCERLEAEYKENTNITDYTLAYNNDNK